MRLPMKYDKLESTIHCAQQPEASGSDALELRGQAFFKTDRPDHLLADCAAQCGLLGLDPGKGPQIPSGTCCRGLYRLTIGPAPQIR